MVSHSHIVSMPNLLELKLLSATFLELFENISNCGNYLAHVYIDSIDGQHYHCAFPWSTEPVSKHHTN